MRTPSFDKDVLRLLDFARNPDFQNALKIAKRQLSSALSGRFNLITPYLTVYFPKSLSMATIILRSRVARSTTAGSVAPWPSSSVDLLAEGTSLRMLPASGSVIDSSRSNRKLVDDTNRLQNHLREVHSVLDLLLGKMGVALYRARQRTLKLDCPEH